MTLVGPLSLPYMHMWDMTTCGNAHIEGDYDNHPHGSLYNDTPKRVRPTPGCSTIGVVGGAVPPGEEQLDMTTTATRTTVALATKRDNGATQGEPHATTRALMSSKASRADRRAHIVVALAEAGLVGRVTPTGEAPRVTPQQFEVLVAFADGASYTQVAADTFRSVETVKRHAGNLYRAWGVNSKVELVVEAVRAGVLPAPAAPGATRSGRRPSIRCSDEGCSKRTTHPSGLCTSHR